MITYEIMFQLTWQKTTKIIKVILWLIPLFLFILILNQHFVPTGKLDIKYNVSKDSKLVMNFASKETDKLIGTKNKPGEKEYFQLITTSPVYFDVKVPRPFQKATVSLKYQNPNSQPDIKLGVKQANEAFYYQDMAFLHPVLESLPEYWDKIQEGNLFLWQKNKKYIEEKKLKQEEFDKKSKELDIWQFDELKKLNDEYKKYIINKENKEIKLEDNLNETKKDEYKIKKQAIEEKYQENLDKITEENKVEERPKPEFSSIKEFINNLPNSNKITQFNYDLSSYFELPYYQKSYKTIEINKSIRGKHEVYTYIGKEEDLNFTFTIQDINRHAGADVFNVTVINNKGEKVKEFSIPDDGDEKASGKVFPERNLQILMENIPYGFYRLVINTNDDVFIKKIVTFQHLLIFKGNIYLTDNEEYKVILGDKKLEPTTLYTNGSTIRARTAHDAGLQKLEIKKEKGKKINYLDINEKHTLKEFADFSDVTEISSPKNDIYIEGDGFFAFDNNQLFNPDFGTVAQLDSVSDIEAYDYIIANYLQAKQEGDWLVAKAIVEAPFLYFHKNQDITTNFIFSLPGLPENYRVLKIKEITIQFEKEPITIHNFFPKLKNFIKRLIKS